MPGDEGPVGPGEPERKPPGGDNTPTPPPGTPTQPADTPTQPADTPTQPADTSTQPADTPSEPRRGRMRYQDPETTTPREPTLAEQRARRQAARRESEEQLAQQEADEHRRKVRKRWLVGGGVAVGLAAVVAIGYAVAAPDNVSARCVGDNGVVVDDSNCDASHVSPYYGGGGLYPIFIGGGGRQYHYYYGGSGSPGTIASGGSTVAPKNANVSTPSGKSIQRGGFGVSGGGKSSGT